MRSLEDVYWAYVGPGGRDIDGRSFIALCRDGCIIDEGFSVSDAEAIFVGSMHIAKRRLDFERLRDALRCIAKRKGLQEDTVEQQLIKACLAQQLPRVRRSESLPAGKLQALPATNSSSASSRPGCHKRRRSTSGAKSSKTRANRAEPADKDFAAAAAAQSSGIDLPPPCEWFTRKLFRQEGPSSLEEGRQRREDEEGEEDEERRLQQQQQQERQQQLEVERQQHMQQQQEELANFEVHARNASSEERQARCRAALQKRNRGSTAANGKGDMAATAHGTEGLPQKDEQRFPQRQQEEQLEHHEMQAHQASCEELRTRCKAVLEKRFRSAQSASRQLFAEGSESSAPSSSVAAEEVERSPGSGSVMQKVFVPHAPAQQPATAPGSRADAGAGASTHEPVEAISIGGAREVAAARATPVHLRPSSNPVSTVLRRHYNRAALVAESASEPSAEPTLGGPGYLSKEEQLVMPAFKATCDGQAGMDVKGFVGLCEKACLLDDHFSTDDARTIYGSFVLPGDERLNLAKFNECLVRVAARKRIDVALIRQMISRSAKLLQPRSASKKGQHCQSSVAAASVHAQITLPIESSSGLQAESVEDERPRAPTPAAPRHALQLPSSCPASAMPRSLAVQNPPEASESESTPSSSDLPTLLGRHSFGKPSRRPASGTKRPVLRIVALDEASTTDEPFAGQSASVASESSLPADRLVNPVASTLMQPGAPKDSDQAPRSVMRMSSSCPASVMLKPFGSSKLAEPLKNSNVAAQIDSQASHGSIPCPRPASRPASGKRRPHPRISENELTSTQEVATLATSSKDSAVEGASPPNQVTSSCMPQQLPSCSPTSMMPRRRLEQCSPMPSMVSSSQTAVGTLAARDSQRSKVSIEGTFKSFCDGHEGMDINGFVQMCEQCCLVEQSLTPTDIRLIFSSSVSIGQVRLDLASCEHALNHIAAKKGVDVGCVRRLVAWHTHLDAEDLGSRNATVQQICDREGVKQGSRPSADSLAENSDLVPNVEADAQRRKRSESLPCLIAEMPSKHSEFMSSVPKVHLSPSSCPSSCMQIQKLWKSEAAPCNEGSDVGELPTLLGRHSLRKPPGRPSSAAKRPNFGKAIVAAQPEASVVVEVGPSATDDTHSSLSNDRLASADSCKESTIKPLQIDTSGTFKTFCGAAAEMSSKSFVRLCKECCLLDDRFSAHDARLVFSAAAPIGHVCLDLSSFDNALVQVASKKGTSIGHVRRMVSWFQTPKFERPRSAAGAYQHANTWSEGSSSSLSSTAESTAATAACPKASDKRSSLRSGSVPCVGRLRPSMVSGHACSDAEPGHRDEPRSAPAEVGARPRGGSRPTSPGLARIATPRPRPAPTQRTSTQGPLVPTGVEVGLAAPRPVAPLNMSLAMPLQGLIPGQMMPMMGVL